MSIAHSVFDNIKNYKANSIFVKCFVIEILLTVLPFCILSMFYYSHVKKTTVDTVTSGTMFALSEISDISDTILNECDMMCSYIANTDRVQMFMVNDWFFESDNRTLGEIDELIRGLPLIYKYVDSVYVYSEFNNLIYNSGKWGTPEEFGDTAWMDAYDKVEYQSGTVIARAKNGIFPYLITIIKPVIINKDKNGCVVFNINSGKLFETVSTSRYITDTDIYLVDTAGNILMSRQNTDFAKPFSELFPNYMGDESGNFWYLNADGEEYYIAEIDSNRFGLKYISASASSKYSESLGKMRFQITLILIGLFLLSIIFAFVVSMFVYKPVDEIIAVIKNPDGFEESNKNPNELKYIVSNILYNIHTNNEMSIELEKRLRLLNQSQLKMLQYQINPHFLYNTLETINWMAVELTDSRNNVSRAIIKLAKMFRNSLDNKEYIISIAQEIEYTKNYLDILKLRYDDMFSIKWELEDGVEGYSIVKICLQPVVENAVYHGLKPKGENGELIIRASVFDEYILFEVEDNGVGMQDDVLEDINRKLHSRELFEGGHIGLFNVNHRIRIIFGEEYGVYVTKREGGGTCVGITIPKYIYKEDNGKKNI